MTATARSDEEAVRAGVDRLIEALDDLASIVRDSELDLPLVDRLLDRARATASQLDVEVPGPADTSLTDRDTVVPPTTRVILDHVGIAVDDLEAAGLAYESLGGSLVSGGDNDHMGMRTAQYAFGNAMVELLAATRPNDLEGFLRKRGPGVHHLTFMVSDVAREAERLEAAGFEIRGLELAEPTWMQCYVMPKQVGGVLIQLVQTSLSQTERRSAIDLDDILAGKWHWVDAQPRRRDATNQKGGT